MRPNPNTTSSWTKLRFFQYINLAISLIFFLVTLILTIVSKHFTDWHYPAGLFVLFLIIIFIAISIISLKKSTKNFNGAEGDYKMYDKNIKKMIHVRVFAAGFLMLIIPAWIWAMLDGKSDGTYSVAVLVVLVASWLTNVLSTGVIKKLNLALAIELREIQQSVK